MTDVRAIPIPVARGSCVLASCVLVLLLRLGSWSCVLLDSCVLSLLFVVATMPIYVWVVLCSDFTLLAHSFRDLGLGRGRVARGRHAVGVAD